MSLDKHVDSGFKRLQEFLRYDGNQNNLKGNIRNTVIGAGTILAMNALNAPDLLNTMAWVYTGYQGFKAYKDLQQL